MGLMGLFNQPIPYKGQVYAELRKQAQASGHPFIDTEFPPDDKALFHSGGKMTGIEWKRPKDIVENPKLFVEGASSNDLIQGELGNCWLVASCSCLATKKAIWHKVIPEHKDQEWDDQKPEKYAGIFHFQFWRYGEWVDVVIDDFLPTRGGKLVYVHSKQENEFWSALLEKAYAKLYGNYEALDGGELSEALEDFTGGVSEPIDIVAENFAGDETKRDELFKTMKNEIENNALMAAAIPAKAKEDMEKSTEIGLVMGHAYGITAVKRVAIAGSGLFNMFNRDKLSMVRLRNPWGGSEWTGAFSDGSAEWEKIDKADREKIGLTFDEDGEFWMTFEDYIKYFTNMAICRVMNTSFFSMQKKWHEGEMHGDWKAPHMSGGCVNNKETFLNNPQFVFDVTEKDGDEMLFSLLQKSGRSSESDAKMTIGFTIMGVEENRHYRVHKMLPITKSSPFRNSRAIFMRHTLPKGRYVFVACTFEPGNNGNFLLRIYASANHHAKELALDKPTATFCSSLCCCSLIPACRYPQHITKLTVLRATGLEKQDRLGGADPYCIIKCEREKIWTPTVKDSLTPSWNTSMIFYRRQAMSKPIKIDIWNSNPIRDDFMGRYLLAASEEVENKTVEVTLIDRKDKTKTHPGKITLQYTTSRNLQFL